MVCIESVAEAEDVGEGCWCGEGWVFCEGVGGDEPHKDVDGGEEGDDAEGGGGERDS